MPNVTVTPVASTIPYDNTGSGLTSTTVQTAITEVAAATSSYNLEGGHASSAYLITQKVDGGGA